MSAWPLPPRGFERNFQRQPVTAPQQRLSGKRSRPDRKPRRRTLIRLLNGDLTAAVRGSRGKRRSAAGGGKSEAVSRKRRDWRARRGAGIAVPRRWKSPLRSLGVSKGPFSTVENGPFGRAAVRRQIPRRPLGGRSHSIASLRLPETSTSFFGSVRLSTPSL